MKPTLILALGFIGGLSLGLVGVRFRGVDADVPPPAERLFYAGELREGGAPAAGPRDIEIRFHSAATGTGNQICTSGPLTNTPLVDGHFRINVGAACVTALAAAQNAYVEVVVGGVSLPPSTTPRPRVAAVPYAAQAAVAATAGALAGPLAATNVTTTSGTVAARLDALDARVAGTVVAPGNDRIVRARLSNTSAGGCIVPSQSGTWVAGSMRTAVRWVRGRLSRTDTFSATPFVLVQQPGGGNSLMQRVRPATPCQTTTTLQQAGEQHPGGCAAGPHLHGTYLSRGSRRSRARRARALSALVDAQKVVHGHVLGKSSLPLHRGVRRVAHVASFSPPSAVRACLDRGIRSTTPRMNVSMRVTRERCPLAWSPARRAPRAGSRCHPQANASVCCRRCFGRAGTCRGGLGCCCCRWSRHRQSPRRSVRPAKDPAVPATA